MEFVLRIGYGAAGHLARALSAVAPAADHKVLRSLRARRGIRTRYAEWAAAHRDRARPLLWMHAPSVGEGLQARPVLQLARAERPSLQLAYTYFSPSAAAFAKGLDVDFRDYLPFDTPGEVKHALAALDPRALVFSKLDVWPVLAQNAADRGVALGLISATLASGSSRRSALATKLLRRAYARLDAVGAIDDRDAERLVGLGVAAERVTVTGDTRYDQVWARVRGVDRTAAPVGRLATGRPTLVAGSTWPADEEHLLPAWRTVRTRVPEARLIIAPHEPTPGHLGPIERWAAAERFTLSRLDSETAPSADVVLVDRVGILGDLYSLATAAYVGGGFHAAGLHSVLEPAAFGAPVAFGPRFANSRDAELLLASGGGVALATDRALADRIAGWLAEPSDRERAGSAARTVVERGLGAAARSWALVAGLLGRAGRSAES